VTLLWFYQFYLIERKYEYIHSHNIFRINQILSVERKKTIQMILSSCLNQYYCSQICHHERWHRILISSLKQTIYYLIDDILFIAKRENNYYPSAIIRMLLFSSVFFFIILLVLGVARGKCISILLVSLHQSNKEKTLSFYFFLHFYHFSVLLSLLSIFKIA